jgi:hypothetical protein
MPNYCEENIWHLCQHADLLRVKKRVLFVSSLSRNTPLQFQKSALSEEQPVWWDYHVILWTSGIGKDFIYDFDSTLPFPCEANQYLTETFQEVSTMKSEDCPLFKIINANDYISGFHSDRSHMKDKDGQWVFPPPTWDVIQSSGLLSLCQLMDFSQPQEYYDLNSLLKML